jgi:hypothetical protein
MAALKGRSDSISVELHNCYRDIMLGIPSTNKYGVAKQTKSTANNAPQAKAATAATTAAVAPAFTTPAAAPTTKGTK